MSIALSEFWTRLVRLGLADTEQCRSLAQAYSQASGGAPPSDSLALAKFLVGKGDLTVFQAKGLLSENFRKLRLGNYVIRSDEAAPAPFSSWTPVQSVASASPRTSDKTGHGLLLRLKNDFSAPATHAAIQQQSAVTGEAIQPVEITMSGERPVLVFSPLPPGRSLASWVRSRETQSVGSDSSASDFTTAEVLSIAQSLCDALATFHEHGLVHNQVHPERAWVTETGQTILLRSLATATPAASAGALTAAAALSWLDLEEPSDYYTAPETIQQQAVPASDVYSLGCLLLRLVLGRRPFEGDNPAAIRASHLTDVPSEVAQAVAKGETGDPLLRILAFAIAKNPQARFQDARQMGRAIAAISAKSSKSLTPTTPAAETTAQATSTTPATATTPSKPSVAPKSPAAASSVVAARVAGAPVAPRPAPIAEDPARVTESPSAAMPKKVPEQPNGTKPPANSPASIASTVSKPAASNRSRENIRPPENSKSAPSEPGTATSTTTPRPSEIVTRPVAATSEALREPAQAETPTVDNAAGHPTADKPIAIDAMPISRPVPVRRRRKKKSKAPLVLGGLGIAVLLLVIGLLVPGVGGDDSQDTARRRTELRIPPQNLPSAKQRTEPSGADQNTAPATVSGFELVDSDRLLWVPPYAKDADPPPLHMLPPGPGAIVSIRLNRWLTSPAGQSIIDGMSPELSLLIERVALRTKLSSGQIDRCTIAMHPGRDGQPQVSLAIELAEPLALSKLTERWGVSAAMTPEGETIYAGDEVDADAFYIRGSADDASVQSFAVGPLEQMQQVASVQGSPIPLSPVLAGLWKNASESSDMTAMFNPNFLLTDARQLLESTAPGLRDPLRRMWIPTVGAVMLAAAMDNDRVYLETRLAPSGDMTLPTLLNSTRETVNGLPIWGENFIVATVPDPSWRLLANRLPSMLRFSVDQTRSGIDSGSVVFNTYLPASGFAQLTLATLLALNTPASAPNSTPAMSVATATSQKLGIGEMLDRPMSISFDQESLEFAMAAVVQEFQRELPPGVEPPSVRIIGGDLQKMGITQNQQIRNFKRENIPLRTVLSDLAFAANPDKTATSTHDPKQALIWVVADDPEKPGKQAILVTTREAASSKYELPPEFQP